MEKRKKKLFKNTLILAFGSICTKGIMFFMTPLFTRWLSLNDYGTFDLISTYISLLIPLITLQCEEAVFRFLLDNSEEENKKKIISSAVLVDVIGMFILIITLGIMTIFNTTIKEIYIYIVLLTIIEAINNLFTMILRGIKQLNTYTISNIIFVVSMAFFVTLFVYVNQMGLKGIILGYTFGYGFSSLYCCIMASIYNKISIKYISKKDIKSMLKYSTPLIPNSISWWIINVSDRTIVSLFLGNSINAILAVANKIPNICQSLFNVFHLSWQESASETINDNDKNIYYNDIMNSMIKILTSICIVVLSMNFLIFKYLFTKEYFSAFYQVPILIFAIMLSMVAQFLGGIYIAKKETKKNGNTSIIAAIVNLVVHLTLIKYLGLYAATISTLVSYFVLLMIRYIDIKKYIDLKLNKNTIIIILIFSYFFITSYLNISLLNIINFALAIIIFISINKNMIFKMYNKFIKKKG